MMIILIRNKGKLTVFRLQICLQGVGCQAAQGCVFTVEGLLVNKWTGQVSDDL
jgi:hypothetical protein